ncbi:MAG: glycosyltransferase family 4 protein [Thermoanaerobaculia bacterium]|nr:glycosyltransferase family 4 protein [Thermoanaerobaculia bacterium]
MPAKPSNEPTGPLQHLEVISFKFCWPDGDGWITQGGFPRQLAAITTLFEHTTATIVERKPPPPSGCSPLVGSNLDVTPLPEPKYSGVLRKLGLPFWLLRHLPELVRRIRAADVVHAVVPGDVGVIGILLAVVLRRRIFVRHCGTWGGTATLTDRFLKRLLPWLAKRGHLVLATGYDSAPPAPGFKNLHWIFATALTSEEIAQAPSADVWQPGEEVKLVTVGRLTQGKNQASIIKALPALLERYPTWLTIAGDGPERANLEKLASTLGVSDRVRFLGHIAPSSVLSTLAQSHIMVFPTTTAEGFPKAVLEGMVVGLPIVATPVSAIPSLLADGVGFLLDDGQPDTVAESIMKLLELPPSQLAAIGPAARRRAAQYSLENWAKEIGQFLGETWRS